MKTFFFSAALLVVGIAPVALSAAEVTTDRQKMNCFNTTCPVCTKAVEANTKNCCAYKPMAGTKLQHPEMQGEVGFCSEQCSVAFQKDPGKYENALYPEYTRWQESKNSKVK